MAKMTAPMQYAKKTGWDLTVTRGLHYRAKKDGHMVILPGTPGSYRGLKNCLAQLKRCERGSCNCQVAVRCSG